MGTAVARAIDGGRLADAVPIGAPEELRGAGNSSCTLTQERPPSEVRSPAAPVLASPTAGPLANPRPLCGEEKLVSVIPERLWRERRSAQWRPPSNVTYKPAGAGSSHSPGFEAKKPVGLLSEPVWSTEEKYQVAPELPERYTSSSPGRVLTANTPARPPKKRIATTSAPAWLAPVW
jgi:hypothetical protein